MKRLCWLFPLLFVAVAFAAPSLSQQGSTALSTFLKEATDRGDVPGVVVAVVDDDGTLYNEAFGVSSTLTKRPMTKDTIFNMASMTKPITSVAIMMLVDEGRLKLDDEVAKYVPKYKDPLVISRFNEADASYETRPAKRANGHELTHPISSRPKSSTSLSSWPRVCRIGILASVSICRTARSARISTGSFPSSESRRVPRSGRRWHTRPASLCG